REDSAALVKETFVRAWKLLGNYSELQTFYSWLCRMAINQTVQFCRQRKNQKKALYTEFDPEVKTTAFYHQLSEKGALLRKLSLSELQERMNQAILQLTPKTRAVWVTHQIQGASFADLTELFNCSEGTIHFRLFFAYKHLKATLSDLIRWNDQDTDEMLEQHLADLAALKTYERSGSAQIEKTVQNTMRIVRSTNNIPSLLFLPEKDSAWFTQPRYGIIALFVLFLAMHQVKRPLPMITEGSTNSQQSTTNTALWFRTDQLYPTAIPEPPPFPVTNNASTQPYYLK
ncbi:MAG: RNA polymerase sigma factor, partial [Kiritimatiellaceae bacterium]|nr:RNA polymerase sigma factor [Kiritimatiellaceae bacterium]